MQAVFSQRIRFKDKNGKNYPDWEEKKLGELLNYEQPTKYIVRSTEYSNDFDTPVLTAGKSFILGYTNEIDNTFQELPVIIFDDFTTASQFVDFPFKVKSSAMKILKAKEKENIRFIFEAMQKIKYEVGGHGRHWISVFANMKIKIPSPEEQEKIAEFLTTLDDKINLINNQLEQTKLFKKSLLQRMFA
jgi:type I restriction enzyme S subunit